MSDPAATVKAAGRRKVLGIPVIALAAVAVGVLVFVAWKTPKKAAPEDAAGTTDTTVGAVDSSAVSATPDFGMTSTGGFNSAGAPITVTPTPDTTAPESNQTWASKSIEWLVESGVPGGEAQEAITLYLNGQPLSYAQGQLRDRAIKHFGPPPEGVSSIAATAAEPAHQQGIPPLTHTVKGTTDNDERKLATLYYGSATNANIKLIQRENAAKIGPSGPWPVGTGVYIPKYHPPMYYTATSTTRTAAAIAKKNHVTEAAVLALNTSKHFPVPSGTVVVVG